ncbi:DUF6318 family protein [Nocardioides sp. AE5]|uniref:DUF6318 family protein n=1 Tax=Nocardioides sp. AE5 TaxID=2962573 RepID=UPI002881E00D|nr:DUF6318 family protein [Nocardioides sp. AE5]MDT0203273.1 DUF6318 family protein [Nocardioides sp. AE5]
MGFVRRVAVVMACVPLLALAACGDEEQSGEPVELPSLSPSAGSSLSVSEPVGIEDLPADEVAPEEFVRAWVEAYDEATFTGDTTRMRSMSAEDCFTCGSIAQGIDDVERNGGSIDVGRQYTDVTVVSVQSGSADFERAMVTVDLVFPAGVTREREGSEPIQFEVTRDTWDFILERVDGHWIVAEIGT